MAGPEDAAYPRPDFVRPNLTWQLLNGTWDFIFDDRDVGLEEGWPRNGLPESVSFVVAEEKKRDVDTITQRIAALPEKLLANNVFEKSVGETEHKRRKIKVPFVFQTPASGINEKGAHEVIWYERKIDDIRPSQDARLSLRFGAVDYEATVWINGYYVGSHRGGHVPFDLDITEALKSPASSSSDQIRLTVRVRDSPSDLTQPRGKQYWAPKPESIFYTPSSGIWQSVWLESVPRARIGDGSHGTILRSDDISSGKLHAKIAVVGRKAGEKLTVELEARFVDILLSTTSGEVPSEIDSIKLDLGMRISKEVQQSLSLAADSASVSSASDGGLMLWSPEQPHLYDLTIRLLGSDKKVVDCVKTTVGMRSIDWQVGDGTLRLNGKPYFQALVLDQGYWPETNITPPDSDSCKADILMSKAMGFNGCRKHQKVEDPLFFYWADRLGYLVWGEMANAYQFHGDYVERFNQEWLEAVKRDMNHPCIVTWTPANESWAYTDLKGDIEQRNHLRQLYHLTKTIDPSRPINDNCGWEHVLTDLTTFHDYSDAADLTKTASTMDGILAEKAERKMFAPPIYQGTAYVADPGACHRSGAPVICTEFGGVNIKPGKDGGKAGTSDWGYDTADDPEDLRRRIEGLVEGLVKGRHCCGFVYTQLTDVEQETNGVYSYDRRAKLNPAKVKQIMDNAKKAYYSHVA